jgi:hypothetical protein
MTKVEEALSWLVISNAQFADLKDHEYELAGMGIQHDDRIEAFLRNWPSKLKTELIHKMIGKNNGCP